MSEAFLAGKRAFLEGKTENDNPHIIGQTKLGNNRLTEEGIDWHDGFTSAKPARVCSAAENAAAASLDVSRFRRKSNRYYQS
jgi:hypothetical protein